MFDSDSEAEDDNVIEERYLLAINVVKATNLKKLPPQPAENSTPDVWAR